MNAWYMGDIWWNYGSDVKVLILKLEMFKICHIDSITYKLKENRGIILVWKEDTSNRASVKQLNISSERLYF